MTSGAGDSDRAGPGVAHPPIIMPEDPVVFDFTQAYDRSLVEDTVWGIGRYDEQRPSGMYVSDIYEPGRNIHMGIDFWAPAGTPVFAPLPGVVTHVRHHDNHRDYGPTIVTRHVIDGAPMYILFGHLSKSSLGRWNVGDELERGMEMAHLGSADENGDWPPHLHFQLSRCYPEDGNMPGVVTASKRAQAKQTHPDPRLILGPIY